MFLRFNLTRHLASPHHEPFWGHTTSTVDWCETNYEVSPFVAEFFNSASSMALVLIGLMGMFLHPWAERRFHAAFLAIIVVGLGSVAFHGTLQKASQALDEVPMLYTAFAFVYITLCQRFALRTSQRYYLALGLITHAVVTTYLVTAFEGYLQFVFFHVSFGTAEFFSIIQMIIVYRAQRGYHGNQAKVIFVRGLFLYMSAFVFWITDMMGCEYINPWYSTAILPFNPQFHAWWHVVVSLGLYSLAIYTLFHRMQTSFSARQPKIEYLLGIVPYVKIVRFGKSERQTRSQSSKEKLIQLGISNYNTFNDESD